MQHYIQDSPDFGLLQVIFDQPGETIVAESGAMVAMDTAVQMQTSMRGGVMAAAKRKLMGGESIFQNTFTSTQPGQRLFLAPPSEGDLQAMQLAPGQSFFLQSGAYVAHIGEQLQLDTKWGGAKGFFSGVGLFMLRLVGPGIVFYASYGAIHAVTVEQGYTADTGHILGYTEGLNFNVRKFGGYKGLFFSGEGLVCDFHGQGTLYLQTRNASSLASFLEPYRPAKKSR